MDTSLDTKTQTYASGLSDVKNAKKSEVSKTLRFQIQQKVNAAYGDISYLDIGYKGYEVAETESTSLTDLREGKVEIRNSSFQSIFEEWELNTDRIEYNSYSKILTAISPVQELIRSSQSTDLELQLQSSNSSRAHSLGKRSLSTLDMLDSNDLKDPFDENDTSTSQDSDFESRSWQNKIQVAVSQAFSSSLQTDPKQRDASIV